MAAIDIFCGAGGWGDHEGIDLDQDVALTRSAAGLRTLIADVSMVPDAIIKSTYAGVDGVVASPPCPPFSNAGTGEGGKDIQTVVATNVTQGYGMDTRAAHRTICYDPRSILSAEPLRWVLALRPLWTAWEQVVGALPIFVSAGRVLADQGYSVWVGILDAFDYGVPQNRKRTILMAHRERMATVPVRSVTTRVINDVITPPHPDALLCMGRSRGTKRKATEPAPTIMFGKSPNDVGWYKPNNGVQLASLTLPEALTLQTFAADYPLQGSKTARYRQVGDSIPPDLASSILGVLTS